MTNVGQLTYSNTDDYEKFHGAITTLMLSMPLEILPNGEANSPNSPTHRVYSQGPSGLTAEIGAAWLRKSTRGANVGKPFLSITVDDPSLDSAMNLVAFPSQDKKFPDLWNVLWRRRTSKNGKDISGAA